MPTDSNLLFGGGGGGGGGGTANSKHAEIVYHNNVDEATKRALVSNETYTGRHYSKSGRGCPLSEVIMYSGRSFWGKRFGRCPE